MTGLRWTGSATRGRDTTPSRWSVIVVITGVFLSTVAGRSVGGRSAAVAAAVGSDEFGDGSDYRVRCGRHHCNLRTHWCDVVVSTCVRCADDCHPGRIGGDETAVARCRKNCKVYYELTTTKTVAPEHAHRLHHKQHASDESKTSQNELHRHHHHVESAASVPALLLVPMYVIAFSLIVIIVVLSHRNCRRPEVVVHRLSVAGTPIRGMPPTVAVKTRRPIVWIPSIDGSSASSSSTTDRAVDEEQPLMKIVADCTKI